MFMDNRFNYLRKKLYDYERSFNNFDNVTPDDLTKIKEEAISFVKSLSKPYQVSSYSSSSTYEKVLSRITTYSNNPYYHSFDKKIIYVIFAIDPDLLMYKLYLASNIPKVSSKDPKIREIEKRKYNEAVSTYHTEVLKLIGITDQRILKYEQKLFNKFYKDQSLVKGVKANYINNFMSYSMFLKSFSSIPPTRFNELEAKAKEWLDENIYEDFSTTLKTAIYNIMYQNKLLGLTNLEEQFAFLILLIDHDLDILKIYEEESRMPVIKSRIISKFGYFNDELIRIEKLYHQEFHPDIKLSPWSM